MIVKICGLRTVEHALVAAEAGAELLGFILAPSRRQVAPELVAEVRAALDHRYAAEGRTVSLVGVFVNAPVQEMLRIADTCGLDVIQLSGDERVELSQELAGRRLLKTVRLNDAESEQGWLQAGPHQKNLNLHVDAHVAGTYGGAGVVADWERAAKLAHHAPILLAGGLHPGNVGQAIRQIQPWGVDVSSGVERDGVKDSELIRAFVAAARAGSYENSR